MLKIKRKNKFRDGANRNDSSTTIIRRKSTYALSRPNNCRAQSVQCTSNDVRDQHWMNIRCNVQNVGQTTENNRPPRYIPLIQYIQEKLAKARKLSIQMIFFRCAFVEKNKGTYFSPIFMTILGAKKFEKANTIYKTEREVLPISSFTVDCKFYF